MECAFSSFDTVALRQSTTETWSIVLDIANGIDSFEHSSYSLVKLGSCRDI